MSNHDEALGKWPNAPLALVLAQVRFDPEIETEYKDVASRLKAALGDQFPSMKALRRMAFVFGNAQGSAMEADEKAGEVGRDLRSDDNRRALSVQDGVLTYTTSVYKDSEHFLAEWRAMLQCLCAAGGVKVHRLGLRYVDFIIPTGGRKPEDYFRDGFGKLPHMFEDVSQTAFVSHEYAREANGSMRVQFGRGFAPPSLPPDLDGSVSPPPALVAKYNEGPSAVLDIDRWHVDTRRMQADEMAGEFQRLRDDICMAFHRILTPEAIKEWSSPPAEGAENA